jgi:hypothetical protein
MKSPSLRRTILTAVLLTTSWLSGCLFEDDAEGRTPSAVQGQWRLAEEWTQTVGDSLLLAAFRDLMEERGYIVDGIPVEFPTPELVDSFTRAYQCVAANCDSTLWVQRSYLVFSNDSGRSLTYRNTNRYQSSRFAYRINADSIYQEAFNPIMDTIFQSAFDYRISHNGDTLVIGFPPENYYLRSNDPLPD